MFKVHVFLFFYKPKQGTSKSFGGGGGPDASESPHNQRRLSHIYINTHGRSRIVKSW